MITALSNSQAFALSNASISLILALLLAGVGHRARERGLLLASLAYLLTASQDIQFIAQGSPGDGSLAAIFWLLGISSMVLLMTGLLRYVRGPACRIEQEILTQLTLFLPALWVAHQLVPQALAGHTAFLVLVARCMLYTTEAMHSEARMGHGWVLLALLVQPALLVYTVLGGNLDRDELRIISGIPWMFIGMALLGVSANRSRMRIADELSQRAQAESRVRQLTYIDQTTGLPTRFAALEQIDVLIAAQKRFGLLLVNIDDFRRINDHFGIAGGDAFMRATAQRLLDLRGSPHCHVLARSGADEFLLAIECLQDDRLLDDIVTRIGRLFRQAVTFDDNEVFATASVGIAIHPDHGPQAEELLRNAATALHEAKHAGGKHHQRYREDMQTLLQEQMWLDHQLHIALQHGDFELHYQPQIALCSLPALTSVEALIRWPHAERGNISPVQFIPRAETSGLIIPLGHWVLSRAAQQAQRWRERGTPLRISVNLSAYQLKDPQLLDHLTTAQRVAGGLLDLEITESALMEADMQALQLLEQCRNLGYGLHLDDFGTGYSSLAQLVRLPFTSVKLDRAFICGPGAERNRPLVRSMVAAARELGMGVIAEGVETQAQADFLRDIGVHFAQGWLYLPAVAPEAISEKYQALAFPESGLRQLTARAP